MCFFFFFSFTKSHNQMLSLSLVSVILHPPQQTCCDFVSSSAICLISHSNSSNRSALSSPPSLAPSSIMEIDISGSRVARNTRKLVQKQSHTRPRPTARSWSRNTMTRFHKQEPKHNYTCESVYFSLHTQDRRRPYIIRVWNSV